MALELDDIDLRLLEALGDNARLSYRELGDLVGLSSPAAADRVRRLEQRGVIVGYGAQIDYGVLGFPIQCIINLNTNGGRGENLDELLHDMPEVVQADRVTGSESHVVRAVVQTTSHLEELLNDMWVVSDSVTNIVTSSPVPHRPMILRRAIPRSST